MTSSRFFSEKRRWLFSFVFVLLLPLLAPFASTAQDGEQSLISDDAFFGNTIMDLTVADVQGTLVTAEGGVLIDVSNARVNSLSGDILESFLVHPGMRIRIVAHSPDDPSLPFRATIIQVRLENEIVLAGRLQEISFVDQFITVSNRRLILRSSFAMDGRKRLKVGQHVTVIATANGTELVVRFISRDSRFGQAAAGLL
jgi:hypothetical protein